MTLVAIQAHQDHARILTDTESGDYIGTAFGRAEKFMPLPQLDACVITQGSGRFGYSVQLSLLALAGECGSFDDFTDQAPQVIATAWAIVEEAAEKLARDGQAWKPLNSVVFLVGYSHRAHSFRAVYLASDFGFTVTEVTGLHVQPAPAPLPKRMSYLEPHRLRRHFALNGLPDLAPWTPPEPMALDTVQDWIDLGLSVWRDRTFAPIETGFKWTIGGSLHLATLTLGEYRVQRVHTFDLTPEELALKIRGTLHPISQAAPCICGSGDRLIDCCCSALTGANCPCGSGLTFERCCSIDAATARLADLATIG